MKGLYVEDDMALGQSIVESLKEKGLEVTWLRSVEDSKKALEQEKFNFYILDVGLLDGEGYEVAEHIRAQKLKGPILFLTARSEAKDRLKGYELGAEEYIPKPFLFEELWLRLSHVLEEHTEEELIEIGRLKIFPQSYKILKDKEELFLTQKEMALFMLLYQNSPKVFRRSEILDRVWGAEKFPSERTVDNIVLKLRQILEEEASSIMSVRGVGYSWKK